MAMRTLTHKQTFGLLFVFSLLTGIYAPQCFRSSPTHPQFTQVGCSGRSCMIYLNERGWYRGCACGLVPTGFRIYPSVIIYYCNTNHCNDNFP